ncbi:MAG: TolC family protein [Phycisphaerales bacterium]
MMCLLTFISVGCQQYHKHPLDLESHRTAVTERLRDPAAIETFHQQLQELEAHVPETFSFADGLSLAEGEVVGLLYNAELRTLRAAAGVARATLEHAGLWDDPEFGFDGAEILSSSSPFEYGLVANLTIPVSGRLDVEKARAGAEHEVALRRIVNAEWSLRMRLREGWTSWALARERVELLSTTIDETASILELAEALVTAGELNRIEQRLLQMDLLTRSDERAEAELHESVVRLELLSLMGLPGNADVELIPAIAESTIANDDDFVARLIASNPLLAIERAAYQAAEESLRLEVRKQYPDITIGSGYGSEGDDRLLLGVSLPVPILNGNRQAIAEAHAAREAARTAAEVTFERLANELYAQQARLKALDALQARFEADILPLLDEQAREVQATAALGDVNVLVLLETSQRVFDARARLLELKERLVMSELAIVELLGPAVERGPLPVSGDSQ